MGGGGVGLLNVLYGIPFGPVSAKVHVVASHILIRYNI